MDSLVGKKVLVVGLGGLGSHAAVGLVCSGVGHIGLCEFDKDINFATDLLREQVARLRDLSPLWEMHNDGIDIKTIQWNHDH